MPYSYICYDTSTCTEKIFLNEQGDLSLQTLLMSNRSIFYSMKEKGRSSKSRVKEHISPSAPVCLCCGHVTKHSGTGD